MALIVLVGLAGAAVVIVHRWHQGTHLGPPIGGRAAAVGDRSFNRAAVDCRLTGGPPSIDGPTGEDLIFGVSASLRLFQGAARCEQTRLVQASGVQAVREDLSWAKTEPRSGVYDWSNYDGVVIDAQAAGLVVLPVLDDAPDWATATPTTIPADPSSYAAFVGAVVGRYGPGGTFWRSHPKLPSRPLMWYELWNEPWYADHNRDPGTYARLVRTAVVAARAVEPSVHFLIDGDAFYETLDGQTKSWIGGMYAAVPDLGRYFNALSVHPYGDRPNPNQTRGDVTDQPVARLLQAHEQLTAHGDETKPLWVTEIGWSTCSGTDHCVTETQQAQYLSTFLHLAESTWRRFVRAVFVYELRDSAPSPAANREAWFGLLRADLSHKPAWQVLHDAATHAG